MSGELDLTPWTRNALIAAGLKREDVEARIPNGRRLMGSAERARGPFRFVLVDTRTGAVVHTAAHGWTGVAEAIDRILAPLP